MNHGLTDRQLYELMRACGMRVCSSEEHHGCPYWKVNPLVGLVWPMQEMWRLADEMEKLASATPRESKEA